MKHHPLRLQIFKPAFGFEDFLQMPGNGLAFPIRVGGQIEVFGFAGGGHNSINVFDVAAHQLVFHGKVVIGVDRAAFGHQIAHMAIGSEDFKVAA